MKKFTFIINAFVLTSILMLFLQDAKAQCNRPVNVSDSLELVGIIGNRTEPVNQWWGVGLVDTLGECRIDSIRISANLINSGMLNLPFLRYAFFESSDLTSLSEFTKEKMPNLESLSFLWTRFADSEFHDLDLPSLKELYIYQSPGISYPIPNFSNLSSLENLEIGQLGGDYNIFYDLPNFDKLPKLKSLILSGNRFTGNLPDFNNLPELENLILNYNGLNGVIPNFSMLPKLRVMELNNNRFEGSIPNFDKIPLLEELKLNINQLTGVIPNFDNLPLLNKLIVCTGYYDSDFIGPIPTLENCPLLNINDVDFSCVRPAPINTGCPISESDSLELVNFYQVTNGDNWQVNNGWLTENMTSWWGIDFVDTLGKCRVNKILIRGIPDEVALPQLNLPFLEELIIDYNNFTGTIPDLSNLTNLSVLNLGNNNFEGDLLDLSPFTKLEELDLSQNRLTGTLPDFSNNPALQKINLSRNLITGTLADFQSIPNLSYLNVSGNQLTDSIPNFSNLANLYTLNVADNELTGGLPNFSNLPFLQSLFIENNQLSGRIPNFNNMTLLEELIVCDNNFEGTAPNFSFSPLLNVDAIDFSCLQAAKVRGYVYYDANENCIYDEGDITLPNGLIAINNGANYQPVDENGFFEIALEVGTSVITFIQTSPLWQTACEDTYTITSTTLNDITEINFANQPSIDCTELTVDIGTPFLRRCFKNTYTVQYCNQGTQSATDAYIEIDFEDEIIPLNASIPYGEENNLLTFQLGEVGIGECGSFTVVDSVSCLAPLSSTGCVEAHIYPDDFCFDPAALWDGANLAVNAFCIDNDSVQFVIENMGEDMDAPSIYKMYEEDWAAMQGEIQLENGGIKVLSYPANGATYKVTVEQTPGHPSQDDAQAFFEFCGNGNFSTGFINSQLLPDRDAFVDIDCEEIIGSYDPNDKLVTPAGVGDRYDIYEGDELTYKIRFQNTGNDTAFTVVLVDTLDVEHLDITTLEVLSNSHPYTLTVEDAQILTFTFNDILLVDSTANEQASHGFVTFKIKQNVDNQIGDVIMNKAYIYFDYNEAIATPRVFNTLAEPRISNNFIFVPLITSIENQSSSHLFAKIYPNPVSDVFYVELPEEVTNQYSNLQLEVYNIQGLSLLRHTLNKTQESIRVTDLNSGIYYYKLFKDDLAIANGKLLIE